MNLIHLTGCMCSGKTHVVRAAQHAYRGQVGHWDVTEFYRRFGVMVAWRFDWGRFREVEYLIAPSLQDWHESCSAPVGIVESSGISKVVNAALVSLDVPVTEVALLPPPGIILCRRARARHQDIRAMFRFNASRRRKLRCRPEVTQARALELIAASMPSEKGGRSDER